MIGSLRGRLTLRQPPQLIVDVHGVGYEVDAPMSTFYQLPDVGNEVRLYTHLVVREDAHTLFGFATLQERRLFRSLIRISGVGARLALGILSGIDVEAFVRCVQMQDAASLTRLPGVGKKTADRLVMEMRDRIEADGLTAVSLEGEETGPAVPRGPDSEAYSALVALGYRGAEAIRMLRNVSTANKSTEEIIRLALKEVAESHK